MLQINSFEQIDQYWASFLGCEVEHFFKPKDYLLQSQSGSELFAFCRGRGWVMKVPELADQRPITRVLQRTQQSKRIHLPLLPPLLKRDCFRQVYGPAYILLYPDHAPPPPLYQEIRPLSASDDKQAEAFRIGMGRIDWSLPSEPCARQNDPHTGQTKEHSDLTGDLADKLLGDFPEKLPEALQMKKNGSRDGEWLRIFGAFKNDRLIATCAVRTWGNLLAELYIDTLPAWRNQGYAKSVASTAVRWVQENTTYIPECVIDRYNAPSLAAMNRLGFSRYGWLATASVEQKS